MAEPKITFNRGQGGLGRPLAGEDHFSGMMFYIANTSLPSGWATPWVTATAYTKGTTLIESGTLYRVLRDYTSAGTIGADVTNGDVVADNSASQRTEILFSIEDLENLGVAKGAAGVLGVVHYHVDWFFKANPLGVLYLAFFDPGENIDEPDLIDLQRYAEGKLRQVGIWDASEQTFDASAVDTWQLGCDTLAAEDKPLSVVYASDFIGTTIAALADLRAKSAKNVSVVVGDDAEGDGAALALANSYSITAMGRLLGDISAAKVSDSVAWVGQFPVSDGTEYDVPRFATGELWRDQSQSALNTLNDKGYIYLKKHTGKDNTYWNDTPTAIAVTNDFAYIENNRTIDKAVRSVRTILLDKLNSPLKVDGTSGQLSEDTIADFKGDADRALEDMQSADEISAFNVLIDPTQNVLSNSEIVLTIQIVPIGVARTITVNIGFTLQVAA